MFLFFRYKHFYAKDESTHPSMVSTHQHRFKGKMCKNVETVSTHVKSVSTQVAVFQKSSLPRSTHSQCRSTLDPVHRTYYLQIWDSRSTHSQSRSTLDPVPRTANLQIRDSRYKHFYAKDESTHPSMVSTHQHRFKGKMCKNVETVLTHVKSVSTQVAVFQKSSLPRSTHSQSRSTLDPVHRTYYLQIWDSRSTHSQSRSTLDPVPRTASLQIRDSRSTLPPGQVDTLRKLFILKLMAATLHKREGPNSLRASKKLLAAKKSSCLLPLLSKCFQKTNSHQFKHFKEADPVEDFLGEEFEEDPTSQIAEHRLGLQAS
ncbi:hypothetical protein Taro_020442, partial [Colocasia esculenta]|nr:hypothetical protein [Colocasia esculenta]